MFIPRFTFLCATALMFVACGGGGAGSAGGSSGGDGGGDGGGGSGSGGGSGGSGTGSGTGGSGASGFYLPFVATSTNGGDTGVFVIPSGELSSTPIFVSRTPASEQTVAIAGLSKQLTKNSSNVVTSSTPYALLYYTTSPNGIAHLYGLKLADTSVVPNAFPVSRLTLNSVGEICGSIGSAVTNVYDPTKLFVVLHTNAGGASSCGKGGDVYQVIHYADSSATAPHVVTITPPTTGVGGIFTPLYKTDGSLGGVVMLDSATGDLDFYAGDSFRTPTVLTTGVTSWFDMVDDTTVNGTGSVGASTAFLQVTTTSGTSVWRVTSSGSASNVYTASGNLSVTGVADNNNVYFTDTIASSGMQRIYQEAIGGGTPLELYSTAGIGLPPPLYFLVGSNGTSLVLTSNAVSATGVLSTSVLTIPVGTPSAPTPIAGPFSGVVVAAMCPSTFGDVASDDLLLNVSQGPISGSTSTSYSSEVLTPSGVVKQAALANSIFPGLPACGGNFGSVLQVQGITDTNGYGGGTVNAFNLSSFSATPLGTTSGSGSYTVPAGNQLLGIFLSDTVGMGGVGPTLPSSSVRTGIAFDVSTSLIVPVSVPNSDVSVQL